MDKVLSRPLFRNKYLAEQKAMPTTKGGIAVLKLQEGGLSVGERRAIKLQPFVSALMGAQIKPGEGEGSALARAFGAGFQKYPDALKTIAAIDKAEAEKLANTPAAKAAKAKADLEKEYRTIYTGNKVVKEFNDANGKIKSIVQASKAKTGAGDLALVFNYMKLLDPTSVVREGEFATASKAAGVPAAIRSKYNYLVGGGILDETSRTQIVKEAVKQLAPYQSNIDNLRLSIEESDTIKQYGIDPNNIFIDTDNRRVPIKAGDKQFKLPKGTLLFDYKQQTTVSPTGVKIIKDTFIYKLPDGRILEVKED